MMKWTRKELKERAKAALRRNYWKVVLVSFIFIFLSGGAGSSSASSVVNSGGGGKSNELVVIETGMADENGNFTWTDEDDDFVSEEDVAEQKGFVPKLVNDIEDSLEESIGRISARSAAFIIAFAVTMVVIFTVAFIIAIAVDVFLVNPLWIGAQRFLLKCVDDKGAIAELGYTFDHHYLNGVKTTFMRDLYVFLWTLLFVIPGIYKKYQYYMVEFILAENPDMPYQEVLRRSKEMMEGQKWDAFVLDLSFILWHMLSFFTCGISEIAFVTPYINLTRAALYRELSGGRHDEAVYIEMKGVPNGL